MSVNGAARGNARGTTANRAVTAVIDGVGHRRLMLPTARQEIQNSSTRSALVPHGTTRERPSSVRPQPLNDDSHVDADDGSTREPPLRRQRQVLQRCCDCSRSSTCALSRPTARSQACPCRVANKRCTSCSCFNNCQNKRAPLPPPTATSDASSPAPAQLRPQSPPQQSNPPLQLPFRPRPRSPAPSQTTRQPSASTIDVDGDVGMTPEPLDRTPLRRPTTTMTTPPCPPRRIQRRPPTLARTRFLLVPVTVAAANRANATARKIRGGPGPAVTPDAGPICPATS
ncbi:hypothetical protein MHU86_8395 [Fragilaria crotonensis]|nr:hypothetical protein MHU86_8395 [Fragilaria crotonensis]